MLRALPDVVAVLPAHEVRSQFRQPGPLLGVGSSASEACMRVVLMSLLMIPLVVGCGEEDDLNPTPRFDLP
jgi:hypothetical protein